MRTQHPWIGRCIQDPVRGIGEVFNATRDPEDRLWFAVGFWRTMQVEHYTEEALAPLLTFLLKERAAAKEEPRPMGGEGDVWAEVMRSWGRLASNELRLDMMARRQMGIERYGQPLRRGDGRQHAVDCYQESLDCLVYLVASRASWWRVAAQVLLCEVDRRRAA